MKTVKLNKSMAQFITPKMAADLLERNHGSNRRVSDRQVRLLAGDLSADKWALTHEGVAIGRDGFLVDGQHRLHAIVDSGVGAWMFIFEFDELDIHATMNRSRPRPIDYITGYTKNTCAVAKMYAQLETGGNTNADQLTPEQTKEVCERVPEILEYSAGVPVKFINAGVLAAAAFTHPIDPEGVRSFVEQLRTQEMMQPGSPVVVLRRRLERGHGKNAGGVDQALDKAKLTLSALQCHVTGRMMSVATVTSNGLVWASSERRKMGLSSPSQADLKRFAA